MLIFAIEFLEIVVLYLKRILKDERSRNTHQRNQYYGHTKHILYFQKQNSIL